MSQETNNEFAVLEAQKATIVASVKSEEVTFDRETVPTVMVPNGYQLKTLEHLTKKFAQAPARLKQSVTLNDAESFITYLRNHHSDSTAVFCDPDKMKFKAIMDYHEGQAAVWGDHNAHLVLEPTRELRTWLANDRKEMSQEDFASFIEDNAPEIISTDLENGPRTPSGSEMLQIALTLSRTENAVFRSSIRLDNGQTQLRFEQQFDDKAGEAGDITIPDVIQIGLVLFKSGSPDDGYGIKARFRYRIKQGRLFMRYELVRPERTIADAVTGTMDYIKDQLAAYEEEQLDSSESVFAFYQGKDYATL